MHVLLSWLHKSGNISWRRHKITKYKYHRFFIYLLTDTHLHRVYVINSEIICIYTRVLFLNHSCSIDSCETRTLGSNLFCPQCNCQRPNSRDAWPAATSNCMIQTAHAKFDARKLFMCCPSFLLLFIVN